MLIKEACFPKVGRAKALSKIDRVLFLLNHSCEGHSQVIFQGISSQVVFLEDLDLSRSLHSLNQFQRLLSGTIDLNYGPLCFA